MIEKVFLPEQLAENPAAKALISQLENLNNTIGESSLYYRFPIFRNVSDYDLKDLVKTDVMLVSRKFGIIIFQCINSINSGNIDKLIENLDELERSVFARYIKYAPNLHKGRRKLAFEVTAYLYLHDLKKEEITIPSSDFEVIDSPAHLLDFIQNNASEPLTDKQYDELKATLEGSRGIIKPEERDIPETKTPENNKGAILKEIENTLFTFDTEQKKASFFNAEGPQRIRGLAGSGKTIILAMKAAQLHFEHPTANILYTYSTKSFHDYVKKLIEKFYHQLSEESPNWAKIHILHSWGGRAVAGVYYNACEFNHLPALSLDAARARSSEHPFATICEELASYSLKIQYDFALLDEAQDFPASFYRLCRKITRNSQITWAYDDFQNILNVEIQDEKMLFGKNETGNYYVDFEKYPNNDVILKKTYRNPQKILVTAFALGLGIYNKGEDGITRMVQRLGDNKHWDSLGFTVEQGNAQNAGDEMVISRPIEYSMMLKNKYLDDFDNILNVYSFSNIHEECQRVSELIIQDITENSLKPTDICVICMDNSYTKQYFEYITKILEANNINTFSLIDAPTQNITFKYPNHVTLANIIRAKGNESASVYVIGADAVFKPVNKNEITARNKLFTAITRATAWVTITGLGIQDCQAEIEELKNHDFKLVFRQISKEEAKTIRIEQTEKAASFRKMEDSLQAVKQEAEKWNLSVEEAMEQLLKK